MKKRSKLSGAAWPTAFVAAATGAVGHGARRKRGRRRLPVGGRMNAVQKLTKRRRRSSSRRLAMALLRNAGTIVSGAAVAADLANQINSGRQTGDHEEGHEHSPNGKRPSRSSGATRSSTHSSNGSNGHTPSRAKRAAPSKTAGQSRTAGPSKSANARKRQSSAVGQKGAR